MSLKFKRRREDFTCGHCGARVAGDGYTNHCPECLWSKHLDYHPGDRAAVCGGLMSPVGFITSGGRYSLLHRCLDCGQSKKNRLGRGDRVDRLLTLC